MCDMGLPCGKSDCPYTPKEVITAQTIYTVPPHVGQNIEVPNGSKVTFYDPKLRS